MGWLRLGVRRLGDGRFASLAMFVLVLVTAAIVAVAPRLERAVADETMRSVIARSAPDARGLQLTQEGRIGASDGPEPLALIDETGRTLDGELAQSIRDLVVGRYVVVDSPRYLPDRSSGRSGTVRLRIQTDVGSHVRYVAGRAPATATPPPPDGSAEPGAGTGQGGGTGQAGATGQTGGTAQPITGAGGVVPPGPRAVFEVALADDAAANLRLGVGDTLTVAADRTDSLAGPFPTALDVRVTGIYEPLDRADPYWLADRALLGPVERSLSPLTQIDDMTALLAPSEYGELLDTVARSAASAESLPPPGSHDAQLRYTWRFVVDPQRLDSGKLDALAGDLARLDTIFPTSGTEAAGSFVAVAATGLGALIGDFWGTWRSVEAILAMVGVGAGAIAALALSLGTLLVAARRRRTVALWRGRGATRLQLAGAALAEALVLAGVPAVAAALAAPLLVPLSGAGPSPLLVAAVPLLVAAIFVATGVPFEASSAGAHARTAAGAASGRTRGRRRAGLTGASSPRRLVFDASVVAAAIAGAYLLRDRGVQALAAVGDGSSAGGGATSSGRLTAGADPLIAAVPALVGIAAGIVAIRLFPLLVRGVSAVATRGRGLVAPLALRRIARGGASNQVLLALLAIAAFGVFASAGLVELERGSNAAAWQDVGASFRISSSEGTLPAVLHPLELPGVGGAAAISRLNGFVTRTGVPLSVLAVDAAAYEAMASGTPADPKLPNALLAGPGPDVSSSTVVPAILSSGIVPNGSAVKAGETASINVLGAPVSFLAVEIRDGFPTLPGGEFVVVNRDLLAATLRSSIQPTAILLRSAAADADPAASAALERQIVKAAEATGTPDVRIESRARQAESLRSSPYLLTVQRGIAFAVLVAALYAALAVAAALTLGGAARTGELAQLRALGLSRRQSVGLAVGEHVPIVVLAFLFGAGVGLALFAFLEPGLGLPAVVATTSTGATLDPARVALALRGGVPLDVTWLAAVLCELVAVLAVGIAIQTFLISRAAPGAALRRGTE